MGHVENLRNVDAGSEQGAGRAPSFPAPPLPLPWERERALDHLKRLVTVTQSQSSVQAQRLHTKQTKNNPHKLAEPTNQCFSKPRGAG